MMQYVVTTLEAFIILLFACEIRTCHVEISESF